MNGVNVACSEKRFEWSVKTRKALYKYKSIYHLPFKVCDEAQCYIKDYSVLVKILNIYVF